MICKKCGKTIDAETKYCQYCGEKIDDLPIKNNKRSIIPGFRTNKIWKKILAVVGYIGLGLVILIMAIPYDYGNDADKMIQSISGIMSMILLLVVPFLLVTNFMGIRHKLPLFRKRKIFHTFLGGVCIYMLIAFGLWGVETIANNFYSEKYFSDKTIAEKEQEQQEAREKEAKEKAEKEAEEREAKEKAEKEAEEREAKEKAEKEAEEREAKEKAEKEAEEKAKEKAEKEAEEKAKEKEAEEEAQNKVVNNKEDKNVDEEQSNKKEQEETIKEEYTIEEYVANCTVVELEALARKPEEYVGKHIIVEGVLDVMTIFDTRTIWVGAWTSCSLEVEYDGMAYDQNFNEIGNIISGDYGYVAGEFLGDETIKAAIVIVK